MWLSRLIGGGSRIGGVRRAGVWQWLDGHVDHERGVGVAAGGVVSQAPTTVVIERLLRTLGRPEQRVPVILVAGTNGKSTTARILAAVLAGSGLRVGLYTSPHLHRPQERITIDGVTITDDELAAVLDPLVADERTASELGRPSWFELMTAAAVGWFADQRVDVAVVETGLGGSGDATAALGAGLVVVTSVGVDHVEYFGDTRWDNAVAEAGAVPEGATVVLAEADPAMHPPFLGRRPSRVVTVDRDFGVAADAPVADGRTVSLFTPGATYDDVFLRLLAPWQAANAATALAAAEVWLARPVADQVVRAVCGALRASGRFELVHTPGPVLMDGAHNEEAATALARALRERFDGVSRTVVVGMTGTRAPEAFLSALGVGAGDWVICTSPRTPRAVPLARLAAAARAVGAGSVAVEADVGDAVRRAAAANDSTLTVVTGSLYVIGEALPVVRALVT
ncbi:bifunctional folylpolyglutamate synthase/dihydrofolate synthase [Prauserella sp. PE36]|nr:bifunctional folylpolyglutamate synthase/dihydrofolate synthase [Prauserella sp. PE36]